FVLRTHAALGNLAFCKIFLAFLHGHSVEISLIWLTIIDEHLLDVCQDEERFHSEDLGKQGRCSILVQDRFNPSELTILFSNYRDPAPTDTNYHCPSFEQSNDRLLLQDIQGSRRWDHSSIASSAVADDMPSFRFSQLPRFCRSIEGSNRLCWILERRVLSIDKGLG